jgi:hypothetical protein
LRVTTVHDVPYLNMFNQSTSHLLPSTEWRGLSHDVLSWIAEQAGFTYTLLSPTGNGTDCAPAGGSGAPHIYARQYNCAMNDVTELEQADVYIGAFFVTQQRSQEGLMTSPTELQAGLAVFQPNGRAHSIEEYADLQRRGIRGPACTMFGAAYADWLQANIPALIQRRTPSSEWIAEIRAGRCDGFIEDRPLGEYRAAQTCTLRLVGGASLNWGLQSYAWGVRADFLEVWRALSFWITYLSTCSPLDVQSRCYNRFNLQMLKRRYVDTECVTRLGLGVMCEWSPGKRLVREGCDHIFHAIQRINNKTDGWYDHLLPGAVIEAQEVRVGCAEGRAVNALQVLRNASPVPLNAIIGPGCSDDVSDIASAESRAASGYDGLVISAYSTAPALANESAFPNLARTATSDAQVGVALARVVEQYSWSRVVVLHDGTVWGSGSAASFTRSFLRIVSGGEVINANTTAFSIAAFDAGELSIATILHEIARVQGSIIFAAFYPRMMRAIFAAYDELVEAGSDPWFQHREDFVWLLGEQPTEAFYNTVRRTRSMTDVRTRCSHPTFSCDAWLAGRQSQRRGSTRCRGRAQRCSSRRHELDAVSTLHTSLVTGDWWRL